MNDSDTVKKLFCTSCILCLIAFILFGCQRTNQTYGGTKELEDSPKYGVTLDVNKSPSKP